MLPFDDPVLVAIAEEDQDEAERLYSLWMEHIRFRPSELYIDKVKLIGRKSKHVQSGKLNIEIRGEFPPSLELPVRPTTLIFPINTRVLLEWNEDGSEKTAELTVNRDGTPRILTHSHNRRSTSRSGRSGSRKRRSVTYRRRN